MRPRAFLRSTVCVFAAGDHLQREQALLAAARLHVRPAALQAPTPVVALVTDDATEAAHLVADARAVGVDAWTVAGSDLDGLEVATRLRLDAGGADVTLRGGGARRVPFAGLAAFVDLRWKAAKESRVSVLLGADGRAVLVSAGALEVDGPSRQGALLTLHVELQRGVTAARPARALSVSSSPTQLGVPPEMPAELIALGLAQGHARRAARLEPRG